MKHVDHIDMGDKVRRAYRRACLKDPSMPPLINGSPARITVNGRIRVYLPVVGGEAVFTVSAIPGWRFHLDQGLARVRVHQSAMVSPSERIKRSLDDALGVIVDLERRAAAHLDTAAD